MRRSLSLAALGILATLVGGCGDEPSADDLAKLPQSVDVRRLDGVKVGDPACHFGDAVRARDPGSGMSFIHLSCQGRSASGDVRVATVLTGEEPAEDAVGCHEERGAEVCAVRHGMITVEVTSAGGSRDLLADVVQRLATLPEEKCRLCGRFYPPERVEELTQRFTGRGRKELGTINVRVDSTIEVWPKHATRMTFGQPPRELLDPARPQPYIDISRGTYRNVIVSAPRRWSLYIQPR